MSSRASLTLGRRGSRTPGQTRRRRAGRTGDRVMRVMCAAAGLLLVLVLADVVYQVAHNAEPAISRFGLGFLAHTTWRPNVFIEGAGALIFGTAVSSAIALVLATPLGIAIGLYLSMIAPPRVRAVVGPLVEMLAAVPSIIYGFWGLVVLVPFVDHLEPGLHSALGFIPLFGRPATIGLSLLSAGLVLTVMILPIISALSRDLFLTVPQELTDGAAALGATRWEIIRGIVLPSTASGVGAAVILGLGRALGEAIAVSFVIGDVSTSIHPNVFAPASSMAERIANQFPGALNNLHVAAMFYVGLILVVIGLFTSLAARAIASRFDVNRTIGSVI
ncbi:MAG TPA: phosphate ABC transporter permease subunit PstC [Solirubrobacteraceae bacterium]|nr:phosphate ABC transporter permease subunit PstC [Solirubrobacteraceae bacterium]